MKELTTEDLWRLMKLAEDHADRFDDEDEVYETYTELANKLHKIILLFLLEEVK